MEISSNVNRHDLDDTTSALLSPITSSLLQWLRREATRRTCKLIVPGTGPNLFRQHLDGLIWPYLKQAVRVPRDFRSIGEAIQAAPKWPPTSILVSAGEYMEHLVIDKPVSLIGLSNPGLKCSDPSIKAPPVVCFPGCEAVENTPSTSSSNCGPELRGFNLQGGSAACIRVDYGSPRIVSCSIAANGSYGVLVSGNANPTIEDCSFGGIGIAGLAIQDSASGTFVGNKIDGFPGGVGVLARGTSKPILERNGFEGHKTTAVLLRDETTAVLKENSFKNNPGCGIHVRGKAQPHIEDNNFNAHCMPAITCQDEAVGCIRKNRFENNFGLGILVHGSASSLIEENRLSRNGPPPSSSSVNDKPPSSAEAEVVGTTDAAAITSTSTYMLESLAGASSKGIKRAAIVVQGQSTAVLRGNILEANAGYGVLISQNAVPLLDGNTFHDHQRPALAIRDHAAGRVVNNVFCNNRFAISVLEDSTPLICSNVIMMKGSENQGILAFNRCSPMIENNKFREYVNVKQCIGVHSRGNVTICGSDMLADHRPDESPPSALETTCQPHEIQTDQSPELQGTEAATSKRQRVG